MLLFITSTTYAQWLPGDKRGFVSNVNSEIHNQYGTEIDADVRWLKKYSQKNLKGEPIFFNRQHADVLLAQFHETVQHRHWFLFGAAIMPNHIHIFVEIPDTFPPDKAAGELKSFGSLTLNKRFGKPSSGTWWTAGCSLRRKTSESIPDVIRYIKGQRHALLVWIDPQYEGE